MDIWIYNFQGFSIESLLSKLILCLLHVLQWMFGISNLRIFIWYPYSAHSESLHPRFLSDFKCWFIGPKLAPLILCFLFPNSSSHCSWKIPSPPSFFPLPFSFDSRWPPPLTPPTPFTFTTWIILAFFRNPLMTQTTFPGVDRWCLPSMDEIN